MPAKRKTPKLLANKRPAQVTEKREDVAPQTATSQEGVPEVAIPQEDTPQVATSQEAIPREDTTQQATAQEALAEIADETPLHEAVRLLYDEPYTAPSSPDLGRNYLEQFNFIGYPSCRLEVTPQGIVIIDNDEEPPRPAVADDTSSPQHKIPRLDDPNN